MTLLFSAMNINGFIRNHKLLNLAQWNYLKIILIPDTYAQYNRINFEFIKSITRDALLSSVKPLVHNMSQKGMDTLKHKHTHTHPSVLG